MSPHAPSSEPDEVPGSDGPVLAPELVPVAHRLFGDRLDEARQFAAMLAGDGVERGLIGPREVDRLWERHLVNCALLADAIPAGTHTVADVGSGAGLPGIVLALCRPDLRITLVETMQRRVTWLEEVADVLGLAVEVVRARAEDLHGRRTFDVVTARAVAALDKLARWTLPLVAEDGVLLAMKGSSAPQEIEKATKVLRRLGGEDARVTQYGTGEVPLPTTVVTVHRRPRAGSTGADGSGKGVVRG